MAKGRKFYVVWRGRRPGIYETWAECSAQVQGVDGAQYRGYESLEAARDAYSRPFVPRERTRHIPVRDDGERPVYPSIAVDAACNMRTGRMEYRGVDAATGRVLFSQGPFDDTTNNVGEFLALVHALALCNDPNHAQLAAMTIYSDSVTAMAWVRRKRANTSMAPTPNNAMLRSMIARAEEWLRQPTWRNPVVKWRTEQWGEIPADYGRK